AELNPVSWSITSEWNVTSLCGFGDGTRGWTRLRIRDQFFSFLQDGGQRKRLFAKECVHKVHRLFKQVPARFLCAVFDCDVVDAATIVACFEALEFATLTFRKFAQ